MTKLKEQTEERKIEYNPKTISGYYKIFMEELEEGRIPLITEDNPTDKYMTPQSFTQIFDKSKMTPQKQKKEKRQLTPRHLRPVSCDPTAEARGDLSPIYFIEDSKTRKKVYRPPNFSKGSNDLEPILDVSPLDTPEESPMASPRVSNESKPTRKSLFTQRSNSSLSSSASSTTSSSSTNTPRKRQLFSPRREKSSASSPFGSSKLSVLVPSFFRKKKENDDTVSDGENMNDDTSSIGSMSSIGSLNDLK